jgi:signal transduction histidine kinase
MVGVLAAAAEPERFARLVLVGPSPRYIDDAGYTGGFSREDVEGLLARADGAMLRARRATTRQTTRGVDGPSERSRPSRRVEGLAVEAARREVAVELHDCAVQLLVAMHRDLDGRAGSPLVVARTAIQNAVAGVRRVSHGVERSVVVEDGGLLPALRALCEATSARGTATVVDLDPDVVRGIDCELVYLAALELVENSVRHGRATQIHLELRHNGIPGAELVGGDNGRGIAAARRAAADDPGIGWSCCAAASSRAGAR